MAYYQHVDSVLLSRGYNPTNPRLFDVSDVSLRTCHDTNNMRDPNVNCTIYYW
jgi:hypothetical protein